MKALVSLLPMLLIGCCSVINGSRDRITVTSEPTGARLFVVGQGTTITTAHITENFSITQLPPGTAFTAKTPAVLDLPKKQNWIIYVHKAGYETEVVTIGKSFDHVYWLNIFNALLGVFVELWTGAAWKAERTEYHFQLDKRE